jgi:Cdc6-like AAA superfamily ATPase
MLKIAIHGISGSGKTTIGKALTQELWKKDKRKNFAYIDQDSYYLPEKPMIKLSNGLVCKNWDTLDALDFGLLRRDLAMNNHVVCSGFALRNLPFDINILLSTGHTDTDVINRCIENRRVSKGLTADRLEKDKLMIREVVYPYFLDTLKSIKINLKIDVYNSDGSRKSIPEIVNIILSYLSANKLL